MGAAKGKDSERIELENVLGCLVSALERLAVVEVRISNRMRTAEEARDVVEVREVVCVLEECRDRLSAWHPQALSRKVSDGDL